MNEPTKSFSSINKKTCRFCQTNQYYDKYLEHLKRKHPTLLKAREAIKNATRNMDEKQLWKVINFIDEMRKTNNNDRQ